MNDEHPILFNDEMVRAILAGRKTQTRRPVMSLRHTIDGKAYYRPWTYEYPQRRLELSPFGVPGDRLWVREAWRYVKYSPTHGDCTHTVRYRADGAEATHADNDYVITDVGPSVDCKWRPSIHMPRWACRLELRVETVRVERVRDISDEDAEAEGVELIPYSDMYASEVFAGLWDSIYASRELGWSANPWVWVCEFSVIDGDGDRANVHILRHGQRPLTIFGASVVRREQQNDRKETDR